MTYRDLLGTLGDLEDEQLDFQVMALIDGEFYNARDIAVQEKEDQLVDGHPYIEID